MNQATKKSIREEITDMIKDSPEQLREVTLAPWEIDGYNTQRPSLSSSYAYHAVKKIWHPNKMFVMVETAVNPAVLELKIPYEKVKGRCLEEEFQYFGHFAMRTCRTVLEELLNGRGIEHASWQTVEGKKESQHHLAYPVAHLVLARQYEGFKKTVGELVGKTAFEMIEGHEAPQNYQLPILTEMHKKKINPLLINEQKELTMNGHTLKLVVDMFCPKHIKQYRESSFDD